MQHGTTMTRPSDVRGQRLDQILRTGETSGSVMRAGVLPANIDDPRFTSGADTQSEPPAAWTGSRVIATDLTDPLDAMRTIVDSEVGMHALLESAVHAALQGLDTLLGNLLTSGIQ